MAGTPDNIENIDEIVATVKAIAEGAIQASLGARTRGGRASASARAGVEP